MWSPARVVPALLRDAYGVPGKLWIARYFASRQCLAGHQPLRWLAPGSRLLHWRSTQTSLAVSVATGALSACYEVAHIRAYAPVASFVPRGGWTVVDVGASIGAFSTWAASHMGSTGRIIAIEPNPLSFALLQRSIRGSRVRVEALNLAAGSADAQQPLHFRRGYTGTSSLFAFDSATEVVQVDVRRLDRIARELIVSHIDLLKLDVEGAEVIALEGAAGILPMTDRVVLETVADTEGKRVREILMANGFRLVHARSNVWDEEGLEILAFERHLGPSSLGATSTT